ncbi:MAG: phenylalanine--tRNA ligase subunit beta [Candidatus Amesbacteria bacterium]|nr:phenylalanine--tRNA ligase subunit beta [Candidatus Amesbacteria bacterium]
MNVPLSWLSDYVKLPKDTKSLTDKLTAIGHMLDKTKGDVIDLELRGNRPDLLGLIGVAREVATVFNQKLKLPEIKKLPKTDIKCPFVKVDKAASNMVYRYTAFSLKVEVGPSPDWMIKRLASWGVPTINNVVDITNYVMIETGQPMHAFDLDKLKGKRLSLRPAKDGEPFSTIQQGQTVVLTSKDLAICDDEKVQCLTLIGGLESKVTNNTTEIALEAATYNQANCRRSSRRLKIMTDGSVRHEKHQHPAQVIPALERAYYLLQKYASAKSTSLLSDFYPKPLKPKSILFKPSEVKRLGGIEVPINTIIKILNSLEFKVAKSGLNLKITPPAFRTDIEESADIVEEILRIYGYDQIPSIPLSGVSPQPMTYPTFKIQETLRDHMTKLGFDEVITLSMINNKLAQQFGCDKDAINLINPPDPNISTLRTSLIPGLSEYAKKMLNQNNLDIKLFEVGKVFNKHDTKYSETIKLGFIATGDILYIKGVADTLAKLLGIININPLISQLDPKLAFTLNIKTPLFFVEINVDELLNNLPAFVNHYAIQSIYPPIIEDININLSGSYEELVNKIKSVSPLIKNIEFIEKYGDKLTLRITYHDKNKQLSNEDIASFREILVDPDFHKS